MSRKQFQSELSWIVELVFRQTLGVVGQYCSNLDSVAMIENLILAVLAVLVHYVFPNA